ncbi:MAG: DUF1302 family protein, partial [Pseudohongiellaceae bacterium]
MTGFPAQNVNQSPHRRIILLASFLGLVSLATEAAAQNDFFSNLDLQLDNASTSDRDWQLLGWVTEKIAYGFESPGAGFSRQDADFNKVETSLFAQFDWRPADNLGFRLSGKSYHDLVYRLDSDRSWSQAERSKLRNRYEVRDLYFESQLTEDLYFRFGNQ